MNDPNVAPGSSSTPNLLDTVGGPYKLSNADAVRGTGYSFGQQSVVAGQPSMAPQGNQPPFEKLAPKSMSTNPGPMGANYKS
jgi:hypothetical protein